MKQCGVAFAGVLRADVGFSESRRRVVAVASTNSESSGRQLHAMGGGSGVASCRALCMSSSDAVSRTRARRVLWKNGRVKASSAWGIQTKRWTLYAFKCTHESPVRSTIVATPGPTTY